MTEQRKYTLPEAVFGLIIGAFAIVVFLVAMLPLDLALAWLRTQVWNWFLVPYLHTPTMNVWLMLALMFFVNMWRKNSPDLKKEFYEKAYWHTIGYGVLGDVLAFLICLCIHLWVLKG